MTQISDWERSGSSVKRQYADRNARKVKRSGNS